MAAIRSALAITDADKLHFREECYYLPGRNKTFIVPATFVKVLSKIDPTLLGALKSSLYNIHVAAAKTYPEVYKAFVQSGRERTAHVAQCLTLCHVGHTEHQTGECDFARTRPGKRKKEGAPGQCRDFHGVG